MAYTFRLETLLNLKRRLMEAAEAELARLLKERDLTVRRLETARRDHDEAERRLSLALAEGLSADRYQWHAGHIRRLIGIEDGCREDLAGLEVEICKARHRLAVKHREKELVERLRERDFAAFVADAKRAEQNQADDMASMRHGRNESTTR